MGTETSSPPPIESLVVMIVEDEHRLREMLCEAIGVMGYQTTSARNAEYALKYLETSQAHIVVLDLNLPQMNGLELFERIHARWPKMQVIILTGFGDLEAAQRAIRLNVVDFLTKPCVLSNLELALDRARHRLMEGIEPRERREPVFPEESAPPATLEQMEHRHILIVLEKNKGNRALTAEELGISERTLYYRLARYQHQDPASS